jgi:hypothetical protein
MMTRVMAHPKAANPAASLPDALRPLAAELAQLPEQDREMVISAARAANLTKHRYPTMSWGTLMSGKGAVSFGGNAVDDCDALYDG